MWATFFSILGLVVAIYVPHYVIGISWELMLFAFVGYMFYLPKKSEWARSMWFFRYMRETHCSLSFSGRADVLEDKTTPRVFGFHPHGVHCLGATLIGTEPRMRHVRVACSSFLFWVPVIKEFCSWGNAFSCDEEHLKSNLNSGTSIIIYPGGINEVPGATYLREPEYQLKEGEDEQYYVYARRRGFIKVAMDREVDIVPCWVDGEYDLYWVRHPFHRIQRWFYGRIRYPWPMVSIGWKWVPFLPKPIKVTVWTGTPIPTKKDGDVEHYYTLYHQELRKLIEQVKEQKKVDK